MAGAQRYPQRAVEVVEPLSWMVHLVRYVLRRFLPVVPRGYPQGVLAGANDHGSYPGPGQTGVLSVQGLHLFRGAHSEVLLAYHHAVKAEGNWRSDDHQVGSVLGEVGGLQALVVTVLLVAFHVDLVLDAHVSTQHDPDAFVDLVGDHSGLHGVHDPRQVDHGRRQVVPANVLVDPANRAP